VIDSFHVPILHGTFSGTQFTEIMNMIPGRLGLYAARHPVATGADAA
jgi:hypothetical protein